MDGPEWRKSRAGVHHLTFLCSPNSLCRTVLSSFHMSRSGRFIEPACKRSLHLSPDFRTSWFLIFPAMGFPTSPGRSVSHWCTDCVLLRADVGEAVRSWVLLSGKLPQLKELLLSYNRIQLVPEELCCCQSLERLELAMNRNLHQLPNQVSIKHDEAQLKPAPRSKPEPDL